MAKNQHTTKENVLKKFLQGLSVCQKLGVILVSKVVQKLSLEKNVFNEKWSPNLIFLDEKIQLVFDTTNWLWKYSFGTFWQTVSHHQIFFEKNPLSMLILGQKSCFLGPTIFKIPQPNWH